jgi:hypothetical protein
VQAIIREFDSRVEKSIEDGLFSGDDGVLEALKGARGAYASYARTFKPNGAGDDVGRVMQSIVERDAKPQEVANFLYGSGQLNGGRSLRLVERLENVLGRESPEWASVQQGLVAKILGDGTDHAKMSDNVTKALNGPGRELVGRVLGDQHLNALRSFQRGVSRAKAAGDAVPKWIGELSKNGFNPRQVVDNLTGEAGFGTVASPDYARGLKAFLPADHWNALRQATWQKLVAKPEGVDDYGTQAIGNRIGQFLNGKGLPLAREMFTEAERKEMAEFGELMKTLTPKAGAKPNSDTTAGIGGMVADMTKKLGGRGHLISMIGGMMGLGTGNVGLVIGAAGLGKAVSGIADKADKAAAIKKAGEAIAGAPRAPKPEPMRLKVNASPAAAAVTEND